MPSTHEIHTAATIDDHFADTPLPSASKSKTRKSTTSTFHIWTVDTDPCIPNLIDLESTSHDPTNTLQSIISRVTVFERSAQPMYPPYIYTRSDHTILTANIGRIIPLFRESIRRNNFTWGGYVKIINVDSIPVDSKELKVFIQMKIDSGGLKKERTKEQWQDTFSIDWCKVTLRHVEVGMGDPVNIADIQGALQALESEHWI